ncbi:heavy metal-associated isoprenylated plant protein 41 isoform X1 [Ziziphus jujuba]|uniref:Heavy metal-associated isoprenylated plant protein 41 isoform X1 n=1 Tax=Ziziphus jujuba TaxID=326968 RepID=A0A6P4AN83_ZIZJJ|nr:heavy metal-associated isoprenylated plant protein 41 isoform X1 [Ziziphus jujuba]
MARQADQKEEEEEKDLEGEEKWVKHYSSKHQILLVGEGDFSFSHSLANSFGSASNIDATSLDPYDELIKKYKEAKPNLENLKKLGASVLHCVDATKMKSHTDLKMRKFDRIIFNFPHAGFHGREDDAQLIAKHRSLVYCFFRNARSMLRANGEIHVNHKTKAPFCDWKIHELALGNCLSLIECVDFKIEDYPGYNNKRGDGNRCDEPFYLGECSTFKFRWFSKSNKKHGVASNMSSRRGIPQQFQVGKPSYSSLFRISQRGHVVPSDYNPDHSAFPVTKQIQKKPSSIDVSYPLKGYNTIVDHSPQHVAVLPMTPSFQSQPTSFGFAYPQTDRISNSSLNFSHGGFPPTTLDRKEHVGSFFSCIGYMTEISGRADNNVQYPDNGLRLDIKRELAMFPRRTLNGDRYFWNELQHLSSLPFCRRQRQHGREEHFYKRGDYC